MKEKIITAIIQACVAGGCYTSGELFFSLCACSEAELIKIASELYIDTTKL